MGPRLREDLANVAATARPHFCSGTRLPPGPISPGLGVLKRQNVPLLAAITKISLLSISLLSWRPKAKLGIAPADVTPDPQGPETFSKCAEAIGYATEGTDHAPRLEAVAGRGRINCSPALPT
jgi:hypothetical protein